MHRARNGEAIHSRWAGVRRLAAAGLCVLSAACSGGISGTEDPLGEEPDPSNEDGGGGGGEAPVSDFGISVVGGPAPLVVEFDDLSTGDVTSWSWDFGDGGFSSEPSPTHLYLDAGFYDVSLTVGGPAGEDTLTRSDLVTVVDAGLVPVAGFTATSTVGVAPLAVSFEDASAGFVTSWSWDFGDGATSAQEDPDHVYSIPGSYDVTLTVHGPLGTNTLTRPGFVAASVAPPVPDFTADQTLGMAPLTVHFTDLTTGVVTAREWNFGDGSAPFFGLDPTHVYQEPGTYSVRLRALGPGGLAIETKTDYITVAASEPAPIAAFSGSPTFGIAPLQVDFTDLSSGTVTSWSWDFGDGTGSSASDPTHVYGTPGTYTVSLTATGPGGSDAFVLSNYVTATAFTPPSADFAGAPRSGTYPLTVAFTDLSGGDVTGWGWDFGDGVTSTQQNPVHTYTGPGRYTVTLGVIGPAGTDAIQRVDYIDVGAPEPVAAFHGTPTSGEAPLTVQFTDTSSGDVTAWGWDFGDGATSNQRHPVHVYQQPGDYTVTLVVAGPGGADVRTRSSYIHVEAPEPVAWFNGTPTSGTAPLSVQFNDLSTGPVTSWAWSFGDGASSNQQDPGHVYDEPGSYSVTLTVTGPGGTDTRTRASYVQVDAAAPVAQFSGTPTSGDAPLTVQFSDASTGDVTGWAWTFGDGGTSTQANPAHTYTEPGDYTVALTVTGPGGSDTRTRTDYVHVGTPAPEAQFSGTPTSGEAPLTVQFADASTGEVTSWAWEFGDGSTSSQQHPAHVYTEAGTYSVRLTVTGPGGSDVRTRGGYVTAGAAAPTALFIGSPTSGTAPLTVVFQDQSSGEVTTRLWSFGDGTTSTQTNPTHVYTTAGTYDVSLSVTGPGGTDSFTRTGFVTVGAATPPDASLTGSPLEGASPLGVMFQDTSSGEVTAWSWNFGDGSVSNAANPSHVYEDEGEYTVSLAVSGPGGSDSIVMPNLVSVGPPESSVDCNAEDATLNNPFPLKMATYDFVPVVPDGSQGFYTVYSARNQQDGTPTLGNNVGIFLFELPGSEVLMFGAGYGDDFLGVHGPLFDAEFDMAMVDEVIQGCMGLDPASTIVHVAAPHGHRDHVNPESVYELRQLGYSIGDITMHASDYLSINWLGWPAQDQAKFELLDGTGCNSELAAFETTLGHLWFTHRPGHTPGSIDAVIDVGGDTANRVLVRGSLAGTCPPPSGTQLIVNAHGNVIVSSAAAAAPEACPCTPSEQTPQQ